MAISTKLVRSMQGYDNKGRSLHPRAVVCNCSMCEDLIVISHPGRLGRKQVQKINNRPVCQDCVTTMRVVRSYSRTRQPGDSDRAYHGEGLPD